MGNFDCFEAVSVFNNVIGHFKKPNKPTILDDKTEELRIKLLKEELQEYIDAKTIEDKFDALIDLVYVALGTAYLMGLPFNDGFKEVHRANMGKTRAVKPSESKRGSNLDIVKPKGWVGPDLGKVLRGL